MSQEFQEKFNSAGWFWLRSHMWLWSAISGALKHQGTDQAFFSFCVISGPPHAACPHGLILAFLMVLHGTLKTVGLLTQQLKAPSKYPIQPGRQTLYHFLWPSLRSHIALPLHAIQKLCAVSNSSRFKEMGYRCHFFKEKCQHCKNMRNRRYYCNYLWKIQSATLGICSYLYIVDLCIIFKQNVFWLFDK